MFQIGNIKKENDHDSSSSEDDMKECLTTQKKILARHGNRNAKKDNRNVEVWWIHKGQQLRKPRGWGTRGAFH